MSHSRTPSADTLDFGRQCSSERPEVRFTSPSKNQAIGSRLIMTSSDHPIGALISDLTSPESFGKRVTRRLSERLVSHSALDKPAPPATLPSMHAAAQDRYHVPVPVVLVSQSCFCVSLDPSHLVAHTIRLHALAVPPARSASLLILTGSSLALWSLDQTGDVVR